MGTSVQTAIERSRCPAAAGRRAHPAPALLVSLALAIVSGCAAVQRQAPTPHQLMIRGARALQAGQVAEGTQLSLQSLAGGLSQREVAMAEANVCAGLVLQHRAGEALAHCTRSVQSDGGNWRSLNNRAAAYSAMGLYDFAVADLERALRIAPHSNLLKRSLETVLQDRRILRDLSRGARAA